MRSNEYHSKLRTLFAVALLLALVWTVMQAPKPALSASGTTDKVHKHWADQIGQPGGPAWQNDILNAGKSDYFEGEVIPHVFVFEASNSVPLTNGATYSFNITYDYYQKNTNAGGFAYVTTFNISRQPGPLNATNPYIAPTADSSFANGGGMHAGASFYTVDADITGVSDVTYNGALGESRQGQVAITFTYTGATTTNGIAEVYFGLYVAEPGQVPDQGKGPTAGAHAWTGGSLQTTTDIGGSGASSLQLAPAAIIAGQISGVKFYDVNDNGIKDAGEPLLSDWTVLLSTASSCDPAIATTTTDANGAYTFSVTPDADKADGQGDNDPYYVCEVNQPTWEQTAPGTIYYGPLSVTALTPNYADQDFGNYRPADRGDLPDDGVNFRYGTTWAHDGAYHVLYLDAASRSDGLPRSLGSLPAVWLGITPPSGKVDSEIDGVPTMDATGDDLANTDDEDGIALNLPWKAGSGGGSFSSTVRTSEGTCEGCVLAFWIDWNNDGDFMDADEAYTQPVAAGLQLVTFDIPAVMVEMSPYLYMRFRLYPQAGASYSPNGVVVNGEVEDYRFAFRPTAVGLASFNATATTGSWPAFGGLAVVLGTAVGAATVQRRKRNRS